MHFLELFYNPYMVCLHGHIIQLHKVLCLICLCERAETSVTVARGARVACHAWAATNSTECSWCHYHL